MHLTAAFLVLSLKDDEFYFPAKLAEASDGFDREIVRKYFGWFITNRRLKFLEQKSRESRSEWESRLEVRFPKAEIDLNLVPSKRIKGVNGIRYVSWSGHVFRLVTPRKDLEAAAVFLEAIFELWPDDNPMDIKELSEWLVSLFPGLNAEKWEKEVLRFHEYRGITVMEGKQPQSYWKELVPFIERSRWACYLPEVLPDRTVSPLDVPSPLVRPKPAVIEERIPKVTPGFDASERSFSWLLPVASCALIVLFVFLGFGVAESLEEKESRTNIPEPQIPISLYNDVVQTGLLPVELRYRAGSSNPKEERRHEIKLDIKVVPPPEF